MNKRWVNFNIVIHIDTFGYLNAHFSGYWKTTKVISQLNNGHHKKVGKKLIANW